MIVVSDTSPLNYLVLINAVDVLPELFGEVHVPSKVIEELTRESTPELVRDWTLVPPEWLRVRSPVTSIATSVRLDVGETEAIALALELQANTLLIDDRRGRHVAEEYGLKAVGTMAVLELAGERELLDLRTTLTALRSTNFYISDEYITAALERDAARRLRH